MHKHSEDRVLFRVRATAEKLDVSISQVYNLVNRGELEFVRVGRAIRIPARAIDKIVAGAMEGAGA